VSENIMELTDAQRVHLGERLQEERARVLRDLGRSSADLSDGDEQDRAGDLTKIPFHTADLGTDTIEMELIASNLTRESRELEEIEAALDRLYRTPDKFGVCEDTGRPIPFERLDVIPWARTCDEANA
jgi:RNA polymerase-binding transcription factor DksA